ncbi:hypothetical protein PUNSTDRAFT_137826 [Punctularia strigosozonata HHB-11173 SS5]|uniref:F-box domain-containing protein n=1 Tax=Punctularia strigosozonata (strain HHB-11173) TaxID=741275 RepID=R7S5B0_PUNST|nr:uncharacterized protein PUNSTDRAFT_137826 [Punctularia strigosozonata HHB-11173 SS5]EIN05144.1 hypothetical protein PUNSTDRAFT_137826 [Punctularia strigosozonata HHB-11173 SS5]
MEPPYESHNSAVEGKKLAHIQTLPTELLIRIFCFAIWSNSPWDSDIPFLGSITRVCHRWKDIAWDVPALWTKFDLSDVRATEFMLEYSKDLRIVLCANGGNGEVVFAAAMHVLQTISDVARVEALYLRAVPRVATRILSSMVAANVRNIETLMISVVRGSVRHWDFELPSIMFSSIRMYHVSGLEFSSTEPFSFHNLEELSIEGRHLCASSKLCDMLSHMSNLQRLYLRNAANAPPPPQRYRSHISLPNLRILDVVDDIRVCDYISAAVQMPCTASAAYSFHISANRATDLQYPAHFSSIVTSVDDRFKNAPRKYCTLKISDECILLQWYDASQAEVDWPMKKVDAPIASVSMYDGAVSFWKSVLWITPDFCGAFDLLTINELILECPDDTAFDDVASPTKDSLLTILQALPAIPLVRASGFYARILCTVLGSESPVERLPFNHIHLTHSPLLTRSDLLIFQKYLLDRSTQGRRVDRVFIRRCGGVQPTDVRVLRHAASELRIVDCFEDSD